MKLFKLVLLPVILIAFVTSCKTMLSTPKTTAESRFEPTYGYYPIDPLPVYYLRGGREWAGAVDKKNLLESLPDETMRLAVGEVKIDGSITFGTAKAGIAGNSYIVILDYIKFNTTWIPIDLFADKYGKKTVKLHVEGKTEDGKIGEWSVPVYVGVGLRLSATVLVNEGSVDLGNLIALGAAAQAKKVTGTMVVQTLGLSGETVSVLIPMPCEINPSTIQNAILSLASIKAKIYDEKTMVTPRALGIYNNLGGGQEIINSFISAVFKGGAWLEIKDVTESIFTTIAKSNLGQDVKDLLWRLNKEVIMVANSKASPQAEGMSRDVNSLIQEATSQSPRSSTLKETLDRIKNAAESLGEIAKPMIAIVESLLPALVPGLKQTKTPAPTT